MTWREISFAYIHTHTCMLSVSKRSLCYAVIAVREMPYSGIPTMECPNVCPSTCNYRCSFGLAPMRLCRLEHHTVNCSAPKGCNSMKNSLIIVIIIWFFFLLIWCLSSTRKIQKYASEKGTLKHFWYSRRN
jgi:hypothetical protein